MGFGLQANAPTVTVCQRLMPRNDIQQPHHLTLLAPRDVRGPAEIGGAGCSGGAFAPPG